MSPASTTTRCFSHQGYKQRKRPNLCHTATWLTPQRRTTLSSFSQISYQRRSWLEITSNLWSNCKKTTTALTFKRNTGCISHLDKCYQMCTSCHLLRALQCF
ncbi:hypothetical protein F7725_025099 [Dissostichus mawsoni]|uniref:Uncharacterized protein n=1 Tax=Dissostichus mawsoni TaxID=36200 RepID=A0A7J5XA69_DISMA|nr:hypothetical protein F7725_025099 [Dissostichus mawsoni]